MFLTSLFITLPQHNDRPYILELDLPPTNNVSPYPVYITHFSSSCCHCSSRKTVSFPFPLTNRSVYPKFPASIKQRAFQCLAGVSRLYIAHAHNTTRKWACAILGRRRCLPKIAHAYIRVGLVKKVILNIFAVKKSLRPWIGT